MNEEDEWTTKCPRYCWEDDSQDGRMALYNKSGVIYHFSCHFGKCTVASSKVFGIYLAIYY